MRAPPDGTDTAAVVAALEDGWGLDAVTAEYTPVGAGSYHWAVTDTRGGRWFVTVDDLDQKAWLGGRREVVFDGLRAAFDTAAALREAGLGFVVAPVRTAAGEPVRPLGERHTVAVFPFLDGPRAGDGDVHPQDRPAVVALVAELHRATSVVEGRARAAGAALPGREHIEAGLRDTDGAWTGGPLAEPARRALAARAGDVAELLALADRLAAGSSGEWVITHGEPHSANVVRTDGGPMLVDWDTVALSPPERDLWMLVDVPDDECARLYAEATGRRPDPAALDLFRLQWALRDLAEYLSLLRSPHHETEDTLRALDGVRHCVSIRDRWIERLGPRR